MRYYPMIRILSICLIALPVNCICQSSPGARDHLAFVYSPVDNAILLYGGSITENDRYAWTADTWTWNAISWMNEEEAQPGNIASMAATAIEHNQTVIMFGGINPAKGDLAETWIWDGNSWEQHDGPGPGPRLSPGMCYDPVREVVVLFSGCAGNDYPVDTWEWNGSEWTLKSTEGPAAGLCRPALFYDHRREKTILFGGITPGSEYLSEMWEWDGLMWSPVDQGTSIPQGRANHLIAYDSARHRAVLFGGRSRDGILGDLWEWDGTQWHEIVIEGERPDNRELYGITYHPELRKVFLYGGREAFASPLPDCWSWDGIRWERVQ
jgi:hypothetical protein